MKTLKRFFFILLSLTFSLTIIGCSNNVNSSLNPVGPDLEGSISTGKDSENETGTATDTVNTGLAPVVNIYSSQSVVGPGTELDLRAEAIDPSGGQISLSWLAEQGTIITTNGSTAVWKAPLITTEVKIYCTATDVRGISSKAEYLVEVIGNSIYRLTLRADRTSLLSVYTTPDPENPTVPVAGAKVEIESLNMIGTSNSNGIVEFEINQNNKPASSSNIIVKYNDWEINYNTSLTLTNQQSIVDSLTFYPGYDGVTVAVAKGDSFTLKKGMVEVAVVENYAGIITPIAEVVVDAGANQGISDYLNGRTVIASNIVGNGETIIKLARNGYQTIENRTVPVVIDGLTLINARMNKAGNTANTPAVISWFKPYNRQVNFPVSNPIEIGFGQPMEKNRIFDEISVIAQNKESGKLFTFNENTIPQYFNVVWKDNFRLQLHPIRPLAPNTRYSIMFHEWNARTVDGRILKPYNGLHVEFTTDVDPSPSILATAPTYGEKNVSRYGPFSIRFDRSMNPDSLYENLELEITSQNSGATVKLNGNSIKSHFSIIWKENNKLLEMVPYRTLQAKSSYQVRLSKCGLMSESGKKVVNFERIWGQFETGQM